MATSYHYLSQEIVQNNKASKRRLYQEIYWDNLERITWYTHPTFH